MLFRLIDGNATMFDFIAFVVAILVAITIHEFAHAIRAHQAGDPLPKAQGRLTLNPAAHYDPIGTTMILIFGLGWGKPVMTRPETHRHPRRDGLMISFWGPLSNILLAIGILLLLRFVPALYQWGPWEPLAWAIVGLNLMLAFFNLIPVTPLDGSKVLSNLLPIKQAVVYDRFMGQYGFLILLLLMFAGQRFISTWVAIPSGLIVRAVMGI
ncbi:MAG: site-2 protease family protein [Armatimonadetes bacterium]|nr:site-2 protease family protein [Armatimonadota bacterium]